MQASRDLGLRVPDDVSIVGFDDAPQLAARLDLTTTHQPSRSKGEYAARALLDLGIDHSLRGRTQPPANAS